MNMESNLPKRKSTRISKYDYNTTGAYFITICTKNRSKLLSRIVGGDVLDAPSQDIHIDLLKHGKIADKIYQAIK